MRTDVPGELLSEVWTALAAVRVREAGRAITDLGFVTAASTSGSQVLVLLRIPARCCRTTEHGARGLLERIEGAVREVSALRDVELTVQPCGRTAAEHGRSSGRTGTPPQEAPSEDVFGHSWCVRNALARRIREGWALDGFQRDGSTHPAPDGAERSEVVRVVVEARIAAGTGAGRRPSPTTLLER